MTVGLRTVFVTSFILLICVTANGQEPSLRGVSQLGVVVESLQPNAEDAGLSKQQLAIDVELRLRKAGIPISNGQPMLPWIYLNVNTIHNKRPSFFAVSISFEFNRNVQITIASDQPTFGDSVPVWRKNELLVLPAADFAIETRRSVGELCDEFINEYLSANPRPTSGAPAVPNDTSNPQLDISSGYLRDDQQMPVPRRRPKSRRKTRP